MNIWPFIRQHGGWLIPPALVLVIAFGGDDNPHQGIAFMGMIMVFVGVFCIQMQHDHKWKMITAEPRRDMKNRVVLQGAFYCSPEGMRLVADNGVVYKIVCSIGISGIPDKTRIEVCGDLKKSTLYVGAVDIEP